MTPKAVVQIINKKIREEKGDPNLENIKVSKSQLVDLVNYISSLQHQIAVQKKLEL